jgi:hypothetical protein
VHSVTIDNPAIFPNGARACCELVLTACSVSPLRDRLFEGFNDLSSPTDSSPCRIKTPTPPTICMQHRAIHFVCMVPRY